MFGTRFLAVCFQIQLYQGTGTQGYRKQYVPTRSSNRRIRKVRQVKHKDPRRRLISGACHRARRARVRLCSTPGPFVRAVLSVLLRPLPGPHCTPGPRSFCCFSAGPVGHQWPTTPCGAARSSCRHISPGTHSVSCQRAFWPCCTPLTTRCVCILTSGPFTCICTCALLRAGISGCRCFALPPVFFSAICGAGILCARKLRAGMRAAERKPCCQKKEERAQTRSCRVVSERVREGLLRPCTLSVGVVFL